MTPMKILLLLLQDMTLKRRDIRPGAAKPNLMERAGPRPAPFWVIEASLVVFPLASRDVSHTWVVSNPCLPRGIDDGIYQPASGIRAVTRILDTLAAKRRGGREERDQNRDRKRSAIRALNQP